jgi:hypothetical protein
MLRLEGLGELKNAMDSSGIESETFRLVALCLNQLRYRVLPRSKATDRIKMREDTRNVIRSWSRICFEKTRIQPSKKVLSFHDKDPLLCLQVEATWPYHKADKSRLHLIRLIFKNYFSMKPIPQSMPSLVSRVLHSYVPLKFYMHF